MAVVSRGLIVCRFKVISFGFMMGKCISSCKTLIYLLALFLVPLSCSAELPETIARVKASIVGVGTMQQLRKDRIKLLGTGFVVGNGNHVLTNAHVIPHDLNKSKREFIAVFYRNGKRTVSRRAEEVARDERHDISLLRIRGAALPAMRLDPARKVKEGELFAFTGFPLGAVLGLYPATHRGIVSALTPFAIPVHGNQKLTRERWRRLADPFMVYQMDAIAYPGNSGSPMYDVDSGAVVAIINAVFVKSSREDVIAKPSGISFAIPIKHAVVLLRKSGMGSAGKK